MTTAGRQKAGLAALRRDGRLFAFVSALLLLIGMFHPLAEARASGTPLGWQICSAFGQERSPDGVPVGAADDCPACITGTCSGAPAKAVQPSVPAFAPLSRTASAFVPHEDHAAWNVRPNVRIAAIRAPPIPSA
ncbi:MAG: hypothetical protein WAT78_05640 [Rhizobiaceae bacterium]